MLYSGTDPVSYITEYALVYEAKKKCLTIEGLRLSSHLWQTGRPPLSCNHSLCFT